MNKPPYLNELQTLCNNYYLYQCNESFFDFCFDSLILYPTTHAREERILDWQKHAEEWRERAIDFILDLSIMGREYQTIYSKEVFVKKCKRCDVVSFYYPQENYCHICNKQVLTTLHTICPHFSPCFKGFINNHKNFINLSLNIKFVK